MINKGLRIMIVDPKHAHRLRLERDFNHQGYYAIAPVSGLDDMFTLLAYGDCGFDLVLINASLVVNEGLDLHAFCFDHPLIGQVCIYDPPPRRLAILSAQIKGRVLFSTVQLPGGAPSWRLLHGAVPSRLSVIP